MTVSTRWMILVFSWNFSTQTKKIKQINLYGRNAKKLNNKYEVGKGIFVLNDEELSQLNLNDNELGLIKPYYTTEELKRYYSSKDNKMDNLY